MRNNFNEAAIENEKAVLLKSHKPLLELVARKSKVRSDHLTRIFAPLKFRTMQCTIEAFENHANRAGAS